MSCITTTRRESVGVLLAVSVGLAALLGCTGVPTPEAALPDHECWMRLDTLYTSGIVVTDTSDVRAVFQAYTSFVDATTGRFCNGEENWTYASSRPLQTWHNRYYWQVEHEAYSPMQRVRIRRRVTYVDQNGVLVWPFPCI